MREESVDNNKNIICKLGLACMKWLSLSKRLSLKKISNFLLNSVFIHVRLAIINKSVI